MKILKLFTVGALLLAGISSTLSAQELGQLHYRVEAGATLSKISSLGLDHLGDRGTGLVNFRVGGSLVMRFEHTAFSFAPGLYLIGRGEKQSDDRSGGRRPLAKLETYALQIPLDLSFRLITFAEDHRIFFNLGPYFAYAVSSKLTRGGEVVSENPKAKTYTKSYDMLSNGHIKRFEFGLQASAMYQWKQLYLRGGIEASAFNQLKLWVPGSVAKGGSASRYIMSYITLGYEF